MKEQILKLRAEGKTYRQICEIVGCNKATVSYHCGKGVKEKHLLTQQKRRKEKVINGKIEKFRSRDLSEKCRNFQRREGSILVPRKEFNFTVDDFLNKIKPICYLSGEKLDLQNGKSYHLDHIIPAAKGGENVLNNAGLLSATVNKMKSDLTVDEFINKCIEVLKYQGYYIRKIN
jgi:hypothetical protein